MPRYNCSICNRAKVDEPGGICFRCQQNAGSYTQSGYDDLGRPISGGNGSASRSPWGSDGSNEGGSFPSGYDDCGQSNADAFPGREPDIGSNGSRGGQSYSDSGYGRNSNAGHAGVRYSGSGAREGISGTIAGYNEAEDKSSALMRWLISMFTWTPFCAGKTKISFMLYGDNKINYGVELNGRISVGRLYDNVNVCVYGRQRRNGSISANKIIITTTGEIIKPVIRINPIAIWLITGALIAIVASGLVRILDAVSTRDFSNALIGIVILCAAIFILSLAFIRRYRGFARTLLGIGIIICVIILFIRPQLLPIFAFCAILLYAFFRIIFPNGTRRR